MSICETCGQSLTQQKKDDDAVYQKAMEMASKENKAYAIYRNEEGRLAIIAAELSPGYPVLRIITPQLQNA